jgi:hypothetical protein
MIIVSKEYLFLLGAESGQYAVSIDFSAVTSSILDL